MVLRVLGTIYAAIDQPREAIELCQESLRLSQTSKDISEEIESCMCLYQAHLSQKQHQKALEYFQRKIDLSDSVLNIDKARELSFLEATFVYREKQIRDSIDQSQIRQMEQNAFALKMQKADEKRNWILALAAGLGVILILIAYGFFKNRAKNQELSTLYQTVSEQNKLGSQSS